MGEERALASYSAQSLVQPHALLTTHTLPGWDSRFHADCSSEEEPQAAQACSGPVRSCQSHPLQLLVRRPKAGAKLEGTFG